MMMMMVRDDEDKRERAVGAFVALTLGRYSFEWNGSFKKNDAGEIDDTCDKSLRVDWRLFENLCFCNRILSQQHVEKNQIRQNLCDLLRRQKFCCRCKDFHKNSQVHMKRFVTPMCRRNVLLQLVARSVHTEWFVIATCRLVCSKLKHRIDQSQSGKLSAWSHAQSSPPNVAFSFEVALSITLYG